MAACLLRNAQVLLEQPSKAPEMRQPPQPALDREKQDALAKQYMSEQYDEHQTLKALLITAETEKYCAISNSELKEEAFSRS